MLLNKVPEGLVPKRCVIYLEDITVHGRSTNEHNQRLEEVNIRLLRGKPEAKCYFLFNQVMFLGRVITPNGILTDQVKC